MTIQTIHWSKYLDSSTNPRVKNFLKYRGDDVLWQVALNVHKSGKDGDHKKEKLVMIIHENAPYAIHIPQNEYVDVLDLAIKYFQDKEEYEKCAIIVKFKQDILQKPKTKPQIHKQKMI